MIKFKYEGKREQEVARWCAIQCQGSYTVWPDRVDFMHIEDAEAFNEFISGGLDKYEQGFFDGYQSAIMEVEG